MSEKNTKIRSRWWYLLPIFMNIIGGVIAYFVLRNDDPSKAKKCMIVGCAIFAVNLGIGVGLGPMLSNSDMLFAGSIQESEVEIYFDEEFIEISLNDQAQFLSVRSDSIIIPLEDITSAHRFFPKQSNSDLRMPGTSIPGSIKAGTYLTENDNKEFWFTKTRSEDNIVTIEIENHEYDRIVLESEKNQEWRDKINDIISN